MRRFTLPSEIKNLSMYSAKANMKIVFLASSLGAGGAERVAINLCNAWGARGDNVTLVSTFSGGGNAFYEISNRVQLVYLANMVSTRDKSFVNYARRFLALRRLVLEKTPDVIVSFLPNVNVAAILSALFLKVPVIICDRDDPSSRSRFEFWEVCSRFTYRYADMFVVQTESVAKRIHSFYPGLSRVRIVPNPLPEDIAAFSSKPPNARKILLSIGRLSSQKQVEKTVDAFVVVASRFDDWDLHIYGDGPQKQFLTSRIQSTGLSDRMFLKGRTNDPWAILASADAFVMTSKHEGFPNALLEAMGVGLPCVVFDCPSGPREITRNGKDAFLVPLNDHETLVSSLIRLMGDEVLRNIMGKRARDSVFSRFRLPEVIERWDILFRELGAIQSKV